MTIFSKVKRHIEEGLPFVLYVLPNQNTICGIFQKDDSINNFKGQSGFVIASFDDNKKYVIPSESSYSIEEEFSFDAVNQAEVLMNYSENEKKHFEDIVQKAVNSIQNGKLNFETFYCQSCIKI